MVRLRHYLEFVNEREESFSLSAVKELSSETVCYCKKTIEGSQRDDDIIRDYPNECDFLCDVAFFYS